MIGPKKQPSNHENQDVLPIAEGYRSDHFGEDGDEDEGRSGLPQDQLHRTPKLPSPLASHQKTNSQLPMPWSAGPSQNEARTTVYYRAMNE